MPPSLPRRGPQVLAGASWPWQLQWLHSDSSKEELAGHEEGQKVMEELGLVSRQDTEPSSTSGAGSELGCVPDVIKSCGASRAF